MTAYSQVVVVFPFLNDIITPLNMNKHSHSPTLHIDGQLALDEVYDAHTTKERQHGQTVRSTSTTTLSQNVTRRSIGGAGKVALNCKVAEEMCLCVCVCVSAPKCALITGT